LFVTAAVFCAGGLVLGGCRGPELLEESDERLHEAVWAGDLARMATLIESSPDLVDARSVADLGTPLHWAVKRGRSGSVRFLLDRGAAVDARDYLGRTALFLAIMSSDEQVVYELLDAGAGVHIEDDKGLTPILWATLCDKGRMVEILLEYANELDIFEAAALGRVERVDVLVRDDPSLVEARKNGDVDRRTPLHFASRFGHEATVHYLLDRGAQVERGDSVGDTPLHHAAATGHAAMTEFLVRHGAKVDSRNAVELTPLHQAAMFGHEPAVEALLGLGADPSAEDRGGRTPLHWANRGGHRRVCDVLRRSGA